jgi:tricorn protease
MKQFAIAMLMTCCAATGLQAQNNTAYFLSYPALTPDGQTLIFSFEGDLWKAAVNNGQATRLTAMEGYETNARVSPDGRWIAFSGRQYGNADVFVMPVNGGEIKQITWHSSGDEVTGWSWDSKTIYFNSGRMGQVAGFKVGIEGGTPQRIFGNNFFQYDHTIIEHPSGQLYFSDTWESSNQSQRKRYKGPFNPDIQYYDTKTKKSTRLTDWEGKDFSVTIDRDGHLYFISDEANGEYNLYTLDNGKKKALTRFSSSIRNPFVNANGGKVVFERDYRIWSYDVKSGKEEQLDITVIRNSVLSKEKDFDVRGTITAYDVSPDGKKLAFISRGELFVSDIEGKFIRIVDRGSAERAREVKWMSDNRTLLFNQTLEGYTNWYTIGADGNAALKQLTSDKKNNRLLVMNKNRSKGVYISGRDEIRLLDTKTGESKTIVKDEIWGAQNSDPSFSPNDEYVLFTAYRNFEQDVFVHNIKENKTTNLTNTAITEAAPLWSADSKYIYFHSQRLRPSYPFGLPAARIYRVALEKIDDPYRGDKLAELFKEEKKDTSKKAATPAPDTKLITIDTDLLMERLEQVGPSLGAQYLQALYQKGEKTSVFYASNHGEGTSALWKTVIEPFEQNKTEKIAGAERSNGFDIVEVNDKLYVLFNGTINKLNLDLNKVDPINISYTFRRNLAAEFNQMYYEAWAQMEENFYDDKFHGINWTKTRQYYAQFLPYLNNRADLRTMLNDMLGELNSSHQGFNSFGDDENIPLVNRTMETGIMFDDTDPYKVKYVVRRSAADRKGIDIKAGDVLVKVNDETVKPATDRSYYFTKPSMDRELKLSFTRGGQAYDVKVHPQGGLYNNLYDEWIDNNQRRVDEKSKGRIAYGYMKNMGQGELDQFIIDMSQELNNKEALIFDLRYNTGGNVHDEVLRFLSQRSYLQWKYREGKLTPQSNFAASDKPIVLLINEQSLSDAEMTAQGFKSLKLGTIIGNGTYRWIIFTNGVSLVDGSSVRMPSWGCYSLDGKDLEVTGVQPDILIVNTFEDKLNGRDPQLDRAIEEIMKKLK